mgnify:FL=1
MKIYGISNCDTVRKARKWLTENGVAHEFHDFRKDGLPESNLAAWEETLGWEALLNRRGTTWRQLPAEDRDTIDAPSAHRLMLAHPTLIKRPVVEADGLTMVGFSPDEWSGKLL